MSAVPHRALNPSVRVSNLLVTCPVPEPRHALALPQPVSHAGADASFPVSLGEPARLLFILFLSLNSLSLGLSKVYCLFLDLIRVGLALLTAFNGLFLPGHLDVACTPRIPDLFTHQSPLVGFGAKLNKLSRKIHTQCILL